MTDKFKGFPPGEPRITKLPTDFFSHLLPLIDDLAELKVTLFCFWAVQQKEGRFRYVRRRDCANDAALMQGLAVCAPDADAQATLDTALARAVARKTLLCVDVELPSGVERLYFINAEPGREALEQIQVGAWRPAEDGERVDILPERPNIFRLYEQNIGMLTPMIAEALKDAEREYPAGWIEDAIRLAVENNARKWGYIRAVLERWEKEGKSSEVAGRTAQRDGQWYISGEYADFIDH